MNRPTGFIAERRPRRGQSRNEEALCLNDGAPQSSRFNGLRCYNAPRMAHQTKLYRRWALEMRQRSVLLPGERVGVAVSGGPDSILLLDFMAQFARQMGLCPAVLHFNHHLRGAESEADEKFVAERAAEYGLPFIRGEAPVARMAREKRQNLEAAARELRYRFFLSLIRQGKLDKVATGHTANDQAETVLLRLLRGAGARGLGGIHPVLEGTIVRPFLSLRRVEIEKEIETRRLTFRTDSSNLNPRFSRNKIRLELLPLLERDFNPAIVPLLKNLADRARDDEAYLEQMAAELARPWRIREDRAEKIPLSALNGFPPAIERRVLRQMIASMRGGSLRGYTGLHFESLRHFAAESRSGKTLTLPGGLEALKEFNLLILRPQTEAAGSSGFSFEVSPPAELALPALGIKFRFQIVENVHDEAVRKTYNKNEGLRIDFERLQGSLLLRNWRPGDRFRPWGRRKAHKIKELFQELKVPLEQRRLWPVLSSGDEIVWVRDFPPAADFVASASSRKFLMIQEEPLRDAGANSERGI